MMDVGKDAEDRIMAIFGEFEGTEQKQLEASVITSIALVAGEEITIRAVGILETIKFLLLRVVGEDSEAAGTEAKEKK